MTRRRPQYQSSRDSKVSDLSVGLSDDATQVSQFRYPDSIAVDCTSDAHTLQQCTCGEREEYHGREDGGLSLQQAQAFGPRTDAPGSSFAPPHHSLSAFPACHYGPYGSTDSLPLSSPAAATFTGQHIPYRLNANAHPQVFDSVAPLNARHSFSDGYPAYPAYLMSDISGQLHTGDAPLLASPSPDDSSDGTASPPTPRGPSTGRQYGRHDPRRDSQDRQITFPDLELDLDLKSNGEVVTPNIHASIERNIFFHDNQWTCYRRNYIFLQCHYNLTPCIPGAPLYVELGGSDGKKMVQALGVSLSASLGDRPDGQGVELVQHTPKRDRGPQTAVGIEKLGPAPLGPNVPTYHASAAANSPHLPLQSSDSDRSASMPPSAQHTFERIQFKQATANNGRRRAAQQFYHLSVELHADIRRNETSPAKWVKVAHRISEPMVVRGRSPGHYSNNKEGRTDSSSGSSGGGSQGGVFPSGTGFAFQPGPSSSRGLMNASNNGRIGMGGGNYNTHQYISTPLMPSSMTSPSLASPAKALIKQRCDASTSAEDAYAIDHDAGYRLFPSSVYDINGQNAHRPLVKLEPGHTSAGATAYNVNDYGSIWHMPTCGRLGSDDITPAFYPNVGATF